MGFFVFVFLKRCSRLILPVQQNQFLLNDSKNNGRAVNIQSSREGTLHYWGMTFGSVEKRKPFHAFRCELTVGDDSVSFFDGCNENFNHCSLRPDL